MKNNFLLITLVLTSQILFSQASSRMANPQNVPLIVNNPPYLVGADDAPSGLWVKYYKDNIYWETYNINGLASYIQAFVTWSGLIGKPIFATVSTSGDYNDLTNKPSVPSPQVNSDWNSISGVSQILNKPTLATVATSGIYSDLVGKPTIYSFSGIGTQYTKGDGSYATFPTVVSSFSNDSGYTTTSILNSGLATKENIISTGTLAQYYRGDKTFQNLTSAVVPENINLYYTDVRARASVSGGTGISYNSTTGVITNSAPDQTVNLTGAGGNTITGTYPNFTITGPALKRQETYSGTTNSSGNYTITFGTTYLVAPNIQANIIGGTNTNLIKISSVTTTGFTVNVVNRLDVIGLLPTYSNVNGASVDVLITEK
jgi:hypothetical protein